MTTEKITLSTFPGGVTANGLRSIPAWVAALENEITHFYGPTGIADVRKASGTAGALSSLVAYGVAIGYAHGSKRASFATMTAPAPKPVLAATPPPPKPKTFADRVSEKTATGMAKSAAIVACVKEFPAEHRAYIANGGGQL